MYIWIKESGFKSSVTTGLSLILLTEQEDSGWQEEHSYTPAGGGGPCWPPDGTCSGRLAGDSHRLQHSQEACSSGARPASLAVTQLAGRCAAPSTCPTRRPDITSMAYTGCAGITYALETGKRCTSGLLVFAESRLSNIY